MVVHGRAPAGGLVLVAEALRPTNRVSVYVAILRSSRWCYGYFLVRRGSRVRKWWPRHDGGIVSAACTRGCTMGLQYSGHGVVAGVCMGAGVPRGRRWPWPTRSRCGAPWPAWYSPTASRERSGGSP